ncbi:MAG TPA: hypothetical protein VFZ66_04060 [Herpetosiphonaceae bacterium]
MSEQQPTIDRRDPAPERVTTAPPPSVDLRIDQLVLHGFDHGSAASARSLIGATVERELARLLSEQGVPPGLSQEGAVARLDGGAFEVLPHAGPEAIGAQIAQAIYRGLGR